MNEKKEAIAAIGCGVVVSLSIAVLCLAIYFLGVLPGIGVTALLIALWLIYSINEAKKEMKDGSVESDSEVQ